MMRIGHVNWSLGLGGAEQVIIQLALACARRGHQVTVFTLNEAGAFAAALTEAGIEVVALHKRGRYDVSVLWRLTGEFRRRRLDVVHTHLWGGNLWGRLAARLAGVPVVIVTEHNVDTWKPGYYLLLDRWLAPWATQLVAVSEEVRQFYETRGVGRGRWQVIYNGIAMPAAEDPSLRHAVRREFSAEGPLLGWIGRLVPAKAPEVFLEAMVAVSKQLPSVKALIVGDGPLRDVVSSKIRELGLERHVVLTGLRQDMPRLLRGLDGLVFSSDREGLSIAMLEAMASGVPIVATRVGGTPELLTDQATGLLVPARDPSALAGAIVRLLQDPSMAARLRDAARARVQERFSLGKMVDQYEHIYQRKVRSAECGVRSIHSASRIPHAACSERIRVCHIIDHLGAGGAQRQLIELVRGLPSDQWEPIVVALSPDRTDGADELRAAGIAVHQLGQSGKLDLRCLARLSGLLGRLRPSIVHTWLFTADSYGRVAAKLRGVPVVICGIRNTLDDYPPRYRCVNRVLARWTDCVTVNADAIRPGLVRDGGVPERKIRTIHNGVELPPVASPSSIEALRRAWSVPEGARVIGMLARMDPQKDYRAFLEAAATVSARVADVVFVLVGDGPLRAEIERSIRERGLSARTRVLGHRPDARQLLAAMDIVALATHYEGCSNVILEAMATGKPVVASDVGGNRELIVEGRTGLLVPRADASSLAQAMERLLSDANLARAMGEAGRVRVTEQFTIEAMVRRTAELYRQLLSQLQRPRRSSFVVRDWSVDLQGLRSI